MKKLTTPYGYEFLEFDSKTAPQELAAPIDAVIARAPRYFAFGYYLSRLRKVPLINDSGAVRIYVFP